MGFLNSNEYYKLKYSKRSLKLMQQELGKLWKPYKRLYFLPRHSCLLLNRKIKLIRLKVALLRVAYKEEGRECAVMAVNMPLEDLWLPLLSGGACSTVASGMLPSVSICVNPNASSRDAPFARCPLCPRCAPFPFPLPLPCPCPFPVFPPLEQLGVPGGVGEWLPLESVEVTADRRLPSLIRGGGGPGTCNKFSYSGKCLIL